jgi:hypothetical protein
MAPTGATSDWPTSGSEPQGTWQSPGYRSATTRSRVAILLVALTTLGYAAQTAIGFAGFGLLDSAAAGTLTDAQAAAYDDLSIQVGMLTLIAYVASAVAFLAWFSRMVENVPPLTGWVPRRTPRAAIGWWFVPFANFWIPFTIAREALRRLDPGSGSWAARLAVAWWGLFLVGDTVSRLSGQLSRRMETLDEIRWVIAVSLAATVMLTVGGCLLIIVIQGTEQISRRRAAALGIGASGAPEWPEIAYVLAGQPAETAPTTSWQATAAPVARVASADGPAEPPPHPA